MRMLRVCVLALVSLVVQPFDASSVPVGEPRGQLRLNDIEVFEPAFSFCCGGFWGAHFDIPPARGVSVEATLIGNVLGGSVTIDASFARASAAPTTIELAVPIPPTWIPGMSLQLITSFESVDPAAVLIWSLQAALCCDGAGGGPVLRVDGTCVQASWPGRSGCDVSDAMPVPHMSDLGPWSSLTGTLVFEGNPNAALENVTFQVFEFAMRPMPEPATMGLLAGALAAAAGWAWRSRHGQAEVKAALARLCDVKPVHPLTWRVFASTSLTQRLPEHAEG